MKSSSIRTAIVLGGAFLAGQPCASAQETTRVSVDSAGSEALGNSECQSISADGWFVGFQSDASNLVLGDTNGIDDAFIHERVTGITERVSVDSSGGQGNGMSREVSLSADGRFIAFASLATNLVAGDTNGTWDVFVHDRVTGTTELVSVDSSGAQGADMSFRPSLSADGRFIAFSSFATNLVVDDTNGFEDVFVHDRVTGTTELVSVDSSGVQGTERSNMSTISADGRNVVFTSLAPNLVANDTNRWTDAFIHDRETGITERVSVDSSANQGNESSYGEGISADGRFVLVNSYATNLVTGDTNGAWDVFIHDRVTGITELVSVNSSGVQGDEDSGAGGISADGRFVAFSGRATNLVFGDTNRTSDTFVRDRSTGITERASVDSQGAQANGNAGTTFSTISADGQIVAFTSDADNLVPDDTTKNNEDVFVHVRGPVHANWTNYGAGFPGTSGVAPFTLLTDPVIGTTVTLDLGNSSSEYTVGALFLGFVQTSLHSTWGGDLLVVPVITHLVGLSPWGASILGDIPNDESLIGFSVDLQAIEVDPGAAKGFSFTQGLELVLGH